MNTDTYKTALEKELQEVTDELRTIGIHNPDNPSDWLAIPEPQEGEADSNVAADRVEDWDERRGALATLETRYNNVTRALKKIADGTFGVCEIGNEQIEEDRLAANPAARTCKQHLEQEAELPQT